MQAETQSRSSHSEKKEQREKQNTQADISVQPEGFPGRSLFLHSMVFKCVLGRFSTNDLFLINLFVHRRIKLF